MITLLDILNWLESQIKSNQTVNYYVGRTDDKQERTVSVFSADGPMPYIALGGLPNTSYAYKGFSVLVRWGKNYNSAEIMANAIYALMFGQSATIGGKRVISFDLRTPEPVGLGADEKQIYEFVIAGSIIYER